MPSTRAVPPSGRASVVSMRTTVVLPAPLGPSRPRTRPSGTSNDTPFTASTVPKHFTSPSATIAGSGTRVSLAPPLTHPRTASDGEQPPVLGDVVREPGRGAEV